MRINGGKPAVPLKTAAGSRVAVLRRDREFRLIATDWIPGGSLILHIDGLVRDEPTATTVQIDNSTHIDVDPAVDLATQMDRYPWRFMNHACDPNTMIRQRDVIAVRNIPPGEELTFNYNTTEYDMAQPFVCRCGSLFCEGTIRGFRHLTAAERKRLLPLLGAHLVPFVAASAESPDMR